MKDYTQLLKHSQFSIVTETAEGAQEYHFHVGPINISTLLPSLSSKKPQPFKKRFSKVQLQKMLH